MSKQNNNQETKETVSPVESIFSVAPPGPVCVADGQGLSVHVHRGHLVVADGIGRHRRERRYHKATHGLTRLVILGSTGTLSLDALRYCDRLDICVAVIDRGEDRPSFLTVPKGTDDARLRRAQATARDPGIDLVVSRMLLGAKLMGQAKVSREVFGAEGPADSIDTLREQLAQSTSLDEIRQLEASAAACYFNAWAGSPLAVPKFVSKDAQSVPEHWHRFDGRRSVLYSNNGNRKAERPVNAILNYLYALLEVEAVLACHVVGLDPGLGMMHADARGRQSMALDLMEPVRPLVDGWTLDLLAKKSFKKSDFAEAPDGQVRLLAPLTHELAATMGQWRKAVAPWAEKVSHLLGEVMKGRYQPVTPLTGENYVRAQREVRSKKAQEAIYRDVFTRESPRPKQRVKGSALPPLANCVECGGPLARGSHVRCPQCWESHSDQDIQTRKRRGVAIAEARALEKKWRGEHPGEKGDPEVYRSEVLPGLAGVPLSRIMEVCGVAKSSASAIRSGKRVPHERHWGALEELSRRT